MTRDQMERQANAWFETNKEKLINHLETPRFKDLPDEGRESDGSLQSVIDAESELNAARKDYLESLNQLANQFQDFVISIPLHVEREYDSRIVRYNHAIDELKSTADEWIQKAEELIEQKTKDLKRMELEERIKKELAAKSTIKDELTKNIRQKRLKAI